MKYEHTLFLTADLSKIIDANHSDDLSEKLAIDTKKLLSTVFDNVNVVGCQDFIREKNEEEDQGDWIRFDPDDKLTWPMQDDLRGFSVPVITCTEDNCIHIGYIMHFEEEDGDSSWELSNSVEDVSLPLDSVIAWQPLPAPYKKEAEAK